MEAYGTSRNGPQISETSNYDQRIEIIRQKDLIDAKYGYKNITDSRTRAAWLVNVKQTEYLDESTKAILAAVDFYFLEDDGNRFKISYPFLPYLYLATTAGNEFYVSAYLSKKFDWVKIDHVEKVDLDLKNHLSGLKNKFLRVSFPSTVEMNIFKRDLMHQIQKNKENLKEAADYATILAQHMGSDTKFSDNDPREQIIDIREYDVPFETRVCIDSHIFVGLWYNVIGRDESTHKPSIARNEYLVDPPDATICAYDIETTKMPLKFPDPGFDQIMMISYMIDGLGFLIINRQIVSEDIENFEYTPRPEYQGEFTVFNEANERALICRFFDHILRVQPSIMATYNGDYFDWPFLETRADFYQISMKGYVGFYKDQQDEFKHSNCIHMDVFKWVQRDSYLPMGSQSLKAAAKAKLRYDPLELDPEEMVKMARENPTILANYSVSDAVATYYLYIKYVHPFIFALCTIIPLCPDDVLRKGSGTLCEALLMVQAFNGNIIFPNKQLAHENKMTEDGHLIDSETYVGGHVESLESGVFRADIPNKFCLDIDTLIQLKNEVPDTIKKSLVSEMKIEFDQVVNFGSVCSEIEQMLESLASNPNRDETPRIYHLDVGAMYPNIILTNRLQPPAAVTEEQCIACIYNTPDAMCKRRMNWAWRGELIPASKGEYERLMQQLKQEKFGRPPVPFHKLSKDECKRIEKKRINDYCRKAYGKLHLTREEERTTTICQRENAFYVDTVLAFRDRRYEYKALHKKAKTAADSIPSDDLVARKLAQSRVVLYDSLQLAHKCILNSFYGYVMRKGSRWFSMEMAGIVCYTGAKIITEARKLIEKVGRPLELDTDGIWCLLPSSFPENFQIELSSGKSVTVSYPGAVLNALVQDKFTNDQYHTLQPDGAYKITSENSIFFEVDGPYFAMILPASKEEGKRLKKRYAVFNFDGSLAELKGFEIKRRGELAIIKHFQSSVFKCFLKGTSLKEVYENVAREADYWLNILFDRGENLPLKDLLEYIAENKSMSKKLEEYGSQKSTSITTAKRLAAFLGDSMVKDKGLACRFIVSKFPLDAPVTDRTIPLAIFETEPSIRNSFLRKWTKSQSIDFNSKNYVIELIDWQYYIERLGSCIQKIVTIPAALQGLSNPVPRVPHPAWLENRRLQRVELHVQPRIDQVFKQMSKQISENQSRSSSAVGDNNTLSRKRPGTPFHTIDGNASAQDSGDDIQIIESSSEIAQSLSKKRVMDNTRKGALKKAKKRKIVPKSFNTFRRINTDHYKPDILQRKSWARNGFNEWIQFLQSKWKLQKTAIELTLAANFNELSVDNSVSIRNKVNNRTWHIIQIMETKIPGQFTVFAVINDMSRRFNLMVPRIIYVDDIKERPTSVGTRVQKTLPKMRPCSYLYEYALDETQFFSRIVELNSEMCLMRINGIYETKVPLLFKALVQLGSTCRQKNYRQLNEISFDQMERVPESDYIRLNCLHLMYFYEFIQPTRSVLAFFAPSHSCSFVVIVNRTSLDVANLNNIYKTELDKFVKKKGEDLLPRNCDEIKVKLHQCSSQKEANRQLSRFLAGLKLSPTEPSLLCLQSNRKTAEFLGELPSFGSFPILRINVTEPANVMNVLDWQNIITKRAIQHFFISYVYLKDYWLIAEYLQIPIANIPDDISTFGLDLFFARELHSKNHLSWASPSVLADFGGKDLEDWRLGNDWETVSFRPTTGYILNKEAFEADDIVVEFGLGAVAVTALLQSIKIAEAEGSSELVGFVSDATTLSIEDALFHRHNLDNYDEGIAVSAVLRILREVVNELVREIHVNRNALADQLVINMHRWLRNKNSLLYHPGICSAVTILMRKLCLLLVSEINRLGGSVIFCSFSKIILSTKRNTFPLAKAFTESLVSSLTEKAIFSSLQIFVHNFSSVFLWIDPNNYALLSCHEDSDKCGKVDLRFALSNRLPEMKGCRAFFNATIAGYLARLSSKPWADEIKQVDDGDEDQFAIYCNHLLMDEIAPNLFKGVTKMIEVRKHFKDANGMPLDFDVPLEFVNGICRVLSINPVISDDVDKLRSQLMLILQTNSNKMLLTTTEITPVLNLVIEYVFCNKCTHTVELNLSTPEEQNLNGTLVFICPQCDHPFSSEFIEEMLIERVSKIQLSYVLQDWQCKECKRIGGRYLTGYCECNYPFMNTISPEIFQQNLNEIRYIAKKHNFINLEYIIKQILTSYM